MSELLTLTDGRSITTTLAAAYDAETVVVYGNPSTKTPSDKAQMPVVALDVFPLVKLSNLTRFQDDLRDCSNWQQTQRIGNRVSYIQRDRPQHRQWLVEELAADYFRVEPTQTFYELSGGEQQMLGFDGPAERCKTESVSSVELRSARSVTRLC